MGSLKFGIAIFPTEYSISMVELAKAVEDAGFESLWVTEHTHIPGSRQSPWPGGPELPKQYWHSLDPFVALTAAAMVTRELRLATGVLLVPEHDPIITAKSVASLDLVSGGRFIFGIGGGWNREEAENHGAPWGLRWKLMRERVEAMKAIWTQDDAEYHGDLVNFDPIWSWPKPVQKPHPPILLGGSGPKALERVIRYADGWMPNRGEVLERLPELRRLAEEAGRGPLPVSTYPRTDPAELERLQEAGVDRAIYYVPSDDRDSAFRRLEKITELARPYLGK
jgi:probable F420-dependent oxidoreductase